MTARRFAVQACTGAVSLQDGGRAGYQRQGLSGSGPMDRLAFATAHALVGNPADATLLEFGLGGGRFRWEGGPVRIALAGAPSALRIDGRPHPNHQSVLVPEGADLAVEPSREGAFAYLALAGAFQTLPVLGSSALHQRAAIGGFEGRFLRAGDSLPFEASLSAREEGEIAPCPLEGDASVRVILGPQADHFPENSIKTLLRATFTLSHRADRMGYQLDGPALAHGPRGYNIVSDATVAGSIQVPGSGLPIVLMADRQTTGGYPKIATVISTDLRRLAQRRPSAPIRFEAVDLDTALRLARERAAELAALPGRIRPTGALTGERLSAANLAGDAVDAFGP